MDLFGAVHEIEELSIQAGKQEGYRWALCMMDSYKSSGPRMVVLLIHCPNAGRDGLVQGLIEGREIGVQKGYELGKDGTVVISKLAEWNPAEGHCQIASLPPNCLPGLEVGFYSGCVQMWRQLQQRDPSVIPERALKAVDGLEEALALIRLENPQASWDAEAGALFHGIVTIFLHLSHSNI